MQLYWRQSYFVHLCTVSWVSVPPPPSFRITVRRAKIRSRDPADEKQNVLLASVYQRTKPEDAELTAIVMLTLMRNPCGTNSGVVICRTVAFAPYIPLARVHIFLHSSLTWKELQIPRGPSKHSLMLSGVFKLRRELKVGHLHARACLMHKGRTWHAKHSV